MRLSSLCQRGVWLPTHSPWKDFRILPGAPSVNRGNVFGHVLLRTIRGSFQDPLFLLVGEGGFEPPTPCL